MTYEEFVIYATDLRNHSDSVDDDWELREYQNAMVSNRFVLHFFITLACQH